MWLHSEDKCSIIDDPVAVCIATGLDRRSYKTVFEEQIMNVAHPLLKRDGNRLILNGLRKERDKQEAYSASRRKGAHARHKQHSADAYAVHNGCSLSPSPSPTPADTTVSVNGDGEITRAKIWNRDIHPVEFCSALTGEWFKRERNAYKKRIEIIGDEESRRIIDTFWAELDKGEKPKSRAAALMGRFNKACEAKGVEL
jgi:hypothetical protein